MSTAPITQVYISRLVTPDVVDECRRAVSRIGDLSQEFATLSRIRTDVPDGLVARWTALSTQMVRQCQTLIQLSQVWAVPNRGALPKAIAICVDHVLYLSAYVGRLRPRAVTADMIREVLEHLESPCRSAALKDIVIRTYLSALPPLEALDAKVVPGEERGSKST